MPLVEHLRELRARLFVALLAVAAGMVVAWVLFDPIFAVLKEPYCQLPQARSLGPNCTLVVTGIFDAFFLKVRVSLIVGSVIASPVWLYEIWAFVTPGLYRNERRWTLAFLATSVPLFLAGAVLAYLTLDKGLALFLGLTPSEVTNIIRVNDYLGYVTTMLLVFGVSFEFPLLIVMLNLAGVVSFEALRRAWRGVIFGVAVFAAVATPSGDPFTMTALAAPMCLLYALALLVARWNDRRRARREAESPYAGLSDDEASPLDLDAAAVREASAPSPNGHDVTG